MELKIITLSHLKKNNYIETALVPIFDYQTTTAFRAKMIEI